MLEMAEKMEGQAKEIEQLQMALEGSNLKKEEGIPELTAGRWRTSMRNE